MTRHLLIAAAGIITSVSSGRAQQTQRPPACTGAEHKHFDFWVGEWRVFNPQGREIGSSRVSRISGGCALLEEWETPNNPGGKSINFFDPADRKWHQVWVGGDGTVLRIAGGLEAGAMRLVTDNGAAPQGTAQSRITWTPSADGTVEQRWENSSDGGATWKVSFIGNYRRK